MFTDKRIAIRKAHLSIPILVMLPLLRYDAFFFFAMPSGREQKGGAFEYVLDIRVMHLYTSYALGFIALFLGLVIGRLEDVKKHFGYIHVAPFIVALVAASFCMVFIPVPYSNDNLALVRYYWLAKLILQQAVVVFTIFGLIVIAVRVHDVQRSDGRRI